MSRLSVVVTSESHFLVVVHELLIVVASLVTARGLQGVWSSGVVAHRLSSCGTQASLTRGIWNLPRPAHGILVPQPGLEPVPLPWKLSLNH